MKIPPCSNLTPINTHTNKQTVFLELGGGHTYQHPPSGGHGTVKMMMDETDLLSSLEFPLHLFPQPKFAL